MTVCAPEKVDYRTTPGASVTLAEREFLREMARKAGDSANIFNIGVGRGASMHCLRAGAPNATLYGIDLNNSLLIGDPKATLITGNSNDPSHLPGEIVDLLFVDGAHDFKCVLYDVTLWAESVRLGGVMIFHDYYLNNTEVREAVTFWFCHITSAVWTEVEAPHSMFALRKLCRLED